MKTYIKAVSENLSPKDHDFSFVIGEEYYCKKGYCFCDTAYATKEYFENPLKTRYLEIEALDEVSDLGDGHSFKSNKIKILREIQLSELRKDYFFDDACKYFERLKDWDVYTSMILNKIINNQH